MKRNAGMRQRPPLSRLKTIIAGICLAGLSVGCAVLFSIAWAAEPPAAKGATVDFDRDIGPIFAARCNECHSPEKAKGGLKLSSRKNLLADLDSGSKAVVPAKPDESELLRRVLATDDSERMPPEGKPLSADQIKLLRTWIEQGAPWSAKGGEETTHWSLKPLARPAVPVVRNGVWPTGGIDRFILAGLEKQNLAPNPPADKRTLLRRVHFDLVGLPPTPEEMDTFLADGSPDAYERVVDRLLASPRHGERWARHWLDVVHYADTHGNDQDRIRPNAWRYRDYVVGSLNADKPYARFVREQLAGDVLFPDDPQGIVALGFIAAGPWDESSLLNVMEDTVDKQIARYLDRDDMVTTAMSTFTSSTVHCARCHNHKFDPISQREYYALQAVFAGVDRAERPFDPDPRVAERRRELIERKAASPTAEELASLAAEQAAWEKQVSAGAAAWTVLEPAAFASASGTTFTKQPDHSLLAGGTRPDTDTYTITATTTLSGITGVRLEVLADESLPHKGPGRQDNGNLHLSEFQVKVGPASDPAAAKLVTLQNPKADFDQQDWDIAKALDGNERTAWGIYPQVGKSHSAVFELKEPVGNEGGTSLTFILHQKHGGGHVIGRPRLSITTAARPASTTTLPENVTAILAKPREERNAAQAAELATYFRQAYLERQLAELPPQQMVYAATSDFKPEGNFRPAKTPRPIHLLARGDVNKPGEQVSPGALACVPGLSPKFELADSQNEGTRRAALAAWITDLKNTLTWRSIVNRAWHYHFGRGIADTPSDFGMMGGRPTHPELIDWLAMEFFEQRGSLKELHRQIVTSAAYRQSTSHSPTAAQVDGDNRLIWRMNRTRLDAESVRDAVLSLTGNLDLTMGGPGAKQFVESAGVHVTLNADYTKFNVDSPESRRRSVYRFVFRTLPDPFMDSLDCVDASQLSPSRNTSVTALQALSMLNNPLMVRQCEHLAVRIESTAPDLSGRIALLYRLVLVREPTVKEAATLSAYAAKHGLANACRVLLNSNEFMFVN